MLAQCDRLGCVREARHRPVLKLSPDGIHYADGRVGLVFCTPHREQTSLDYLITDESWSLVRLGFLKHGRVPPERQHTKLEWADLEAPPETAL